MKTVGLVLIFVAANVVAEDTQNGALGIDERNYVFFADPSQEVPPSTGVSATTAGAGAFHWRSDTQQLSWDYYYEDLTGDPTGTHVHGPAPVGSNAGVLLNMGTDNNPPSSGNGSFTLTNADHMSAGMTYINFHTSANGSGEIRGQIIPIESEYTWEAVLTPDQTISPITGDTSMAQGTAVVRFDSSTKTLTWDVAYSGLTSPTTATHIHAPARTGQGGPVALGIGGPGATSPITGTSNLSSPLDLVAYSEVEYSYINIHTQTNTSGEIRGQLRRIVFKNGFD